MGQKQSKLSTALPPGHWTHSDSQQTSTNCRQEKPPYQSRGRWAAASWSLDGTSWFGPAESRGVESQLWTRGSDVKLPLTQKSRVKLLLQNPAIRWEFIRLQKCRKAQRHNPAGLIVDAMQTAWGCVCVCVCGGGGGGGKSHREMGGGRPMTASQSSTLD